jgi:microcystin-dependent protein
LCDGQTLPIAQNQLLFGLLGTRYGGDGTSTFALPNLQGRVQVSSGRGNGLSAYALGQTGGETAHVLTQEEMPNHGHSAVFATDTTQLSPQGHYWAPNTGGNATYSATPAGTMMSSAVGVSGNSQAHPNMQPSLALNFCISLTGPVPPRS